jgi:hypothetical protein
MLVRWLKNYSGKYCSVQEVPSPDDHMNVVRAPVADEEFKVALTVHVSRADAPVGAH